MSDPVIPNLHQLGRDRGRGNMLGIEPYMVPQDYATAESFFDKLNGCLLAAQREKWLNEKTIVVFPEYTGSWLVLAGESEKIVHAASLSSAERIMVLHNLGRFITNLLASREKSRAEAAFFRMKAKQMAGIYHEVFSRLAGKYTVTVVAGSIILPEFQISNRELSLSDGPLYNTTVVYQPDGIPFPKPVLKAFPTARELAFTTPASAEDIPSFDTPAGRLGVLICADSWFPQAYLPLKEQGIELLAVPSYGGFAAHTWNDPWYGYDGWQAPADVDPGDIRRITEGQAWSRYSLAGRIRLGGAKYGINVFLRGKLWEQDSGGWPATLVRDDEVFVEEQTNRAAILNLWI